uniref:Rab3 GTPase-activating protein catalytic subunit n=1 Tax=Angiostrongylus cantonensis TaxID=6313 RepID=A0A0K0DQ22_ANGCA
MPHWTWLMPGLMRPPSPTLPAPTSLETTNTAPQEHEQAKWSSPSSVESNGLKTDSTAGESGNIDIVGMDGSESSTSSTSTQTAFRHLVDRFDSVYGRLHLGNDYLTFVPIEHIVQKQQNDDYVKLIREQDLSDERINAIPIPVPQALSLDPTFRAVSEQQVVQQVVQNKRFDEVDVRESMTHLCKKLAEKRVFGSKLMAETTVAGLNHSTFPNLPIEGIMYIQQIIDVCRKVLGDRFSSDDDFWESLRDSMRKLAARCRRVRHAKKTKSSREEGLSTGDRNALPATLAEMTSAWSLLQLHKNTESLLQRDIHFDDTASP